MNQGAGSGPRPAASPVRRGVSIEYSNVYMYCHAYMNAFQVLADPTRRQIIETLRHGEHRVNDIVDATDIHQSGVSRHLRLLLAAGFVQVRPDGQRRLYSLRAAPFRELGSWVAGYQQLWDARLTRFAEALEKKKTADTVPRNLRKGVKHGDDR